MVIWLAAALFAALILAASLYALALSGHFPREFRSPRLQGLAGGAVMLTTALMSVVAVGLGLYASWQRIPWFMMVIGGGASVLMTPLVLAAFPDRFVNGRGALLAFASAALLLAIIVFDVL